MNILLVEDEARVADFIHRGLKAEGWLVSVAPDGATALSMAAEADFDVILLDLMLPGIDGQDVCRRLRAKGNVTPILMLTALADIEDRIAGLRIGADDYLPKPFDFEELLARIEALARRAGAYRDSPADEAMLAVGALTFDTRSLQARSAGEPVELTPKEREILKLFLSNPGKIFSRERILSTVWSVYEDPQTNVVDVYVGRLRKKLGEAASVIETVRGAGYRCKAPAPDRG